MVCIESKLEHAARDRCSLMLRQVAEQLINPFGEDDDDFEVNWCIDRNMEVSMVAADQMYGKHPKLEKDKFWSMEKLDIPYTAAAANHKVEPFMGSTYDMRYFTHCTSVLQILLSVFIATKFETLFSNCPSNSLEERRLRNCL